MRTSDGRFDIAPLEADEPFTRETYIEKYVRYMCRYSKKRTEEDIQERIAELMAVNTEEDYQRTIRYPDIVPGFEDTFWYKKPTITQIPTYHSFQERTIIDMNSAYRQRQLETSKPSMFALMYCESAFYVKERGGYILKLIEPYRTMYSDPIEMPLRAAQYCIGHIVSVKIEIWGDNDLHAVDVTKVLPYSMHNKILKDYREAYYETEDGGVMFEWRDDEHL